MGWPTNYSGPQMDASLEKGRNLKVVDNGWIKLDSSIDNPIDLNSLKNPGNYSIFYWVNGPSLDEPSVRPINISIVSINEKIYQFITVGEWNFGSAISMIMAIIMMLMMMSVRKAEDRTQGRKE